MGKARILDGIWTRNVPWENDGEWRTDIFKTTLSDPRLRFAKFVLKGGPTVIVPVADLRRAIEGGRDHYSHAIWGPFDINPTRRTIDHQHVEMEVVD